MGKGIRCPLAGKGYPLPTGRERVWLFRYCCSTSRISQSSATSGSLATGTGGVVGLAAEGVDGGVKFGSPGTLVSPGRGNSRYIHMKELKQDFRLNVTDPCTGIIFSTVYALRLVNGHDIALHRTKPNLSAHTS